MKIYTKTGDRGTTCLANGERVAKDDMRIEAYGTIDELNAQLGLLGSYLGDATAEAEMLVQVQSVLFEVGSALAGWQGGACAFADEVARLEQQIDAIEAHLPRQFSFVLPAGSRRAALAHVCRTVCRHAERRMVALARSIEIDADAMRYVNRLSDYLYVLARYFNILDGVEEKKWQKTCKSQ